MGGFITESKVLDNWRWTEWVTLIMSRLALVLLVGLMPETYPNTLLRWRAKHLRTVTGDGRFRASIEVRSEGFLRWLKRALYKPFLLTFREPIIGLIVLYLTVIYIVLFTFLDVYTFIFQDIHGVSQGFIGLCFLGVMIGGQRAGATAVLMGETRPEEDQGERWQLASSRVQTLVFDAGRCMGDSNLAVLDELDKPSLDRYMVADCCERPISLWSSMRLYLLV